MVELSSAAAPRDTLAFENIFPRWHVAERKRPRTTRPIERVALAAKANRTAAPAYARPARKYAREPRVSRLAPSSI